MDTLTRQWRYRVFAATWLSYVGFYFCRKPFSIVKSPMGKELGFDATSLGEIGAAYLFAYAVGQFLAGWMGNKLGPRMNLMIGMGLSIFVGVGFGFSDVYWGFVLLSALNGLAQATGWSGNVGTMANWFHHKERGKVMGVWATNFTAGSLLAGPFAAWVLGAYGWRASFYAGSVVLLAVWTFFVFNQRNKPEDLGLAPIDAHEVIPAGGGLGWTRDTAINIGLVGTFYFFVKLIRYALWGWAPYFLTESFGQSSEQAGYLSTAFDLAGIPGVFLTGWLSDKVFGSRRAIVSLFSMIALTLAMVLLWTVGTGSSTAFVICLLLIGFTLYGPDALMTGAGAMDIGSRRGAVLAAGIISGLGSFGPVVQEYVIGRMYDQKGGDLAPIFLMLLCSAGLSTAALVVMVIRGRQGKATV